MEVGKGSKDTAVWSVSGHYYEQRVFVAPQGVKKYFHDARMCDVGHCTSDMRTWKGTYYEGVQNQGS